MEADDIQAHGCKYPRISNGNGRIESSKIGQKRDDSQCADEEDGELTRGRTNGGGFGGGIDLSGGLGRFSGWPSSRIVRVSRASGGKDRHSKVLTSKGPRDRRVRLSVNTAIHFYDLQDRLGYDQPSKAVEWLLKAAAGSISKLPSISSAFPDTPKQPSDEKRSSSVDNDQQGFDSDEVDMDGGGGDPQQTGAMLSKSGSGKGSGLSLSRSENRVKARERAKERVAEKEKEKENESHVEHLNPLSHTTSFTELLSVGMNNISVTNTNLNGSVHQNTSSNESNFFQKSSRQWSSAPMDYFNSELLGPPATRPGQIHLGNPLSQPVCSQLFSLSGEHQPELQHISFPEHYGSAVTARSNNNNHNGADEYNLNFTISSSAGSSSLAGFNRGTLQSNSSSPSLLPHLQRFPPMDGSPNFFIGTTASPVENHHQFLSGLDARLQLCYGDGGRQPQKGKRKN